MRTLFLLIRRFKNLLLFIFLEVIAIVLIINAKSLQGNDLLSSSNAIAGFFYNRKDDVVNYFRLRTINKDLVNENATLRAQLASYQGVDTLQNIVISNPIFQIDSVKTTDSLGETKYVGERKIIRYATYEYTPAKVVNNSIANENVNYLTINRGGNDGIKPGDAVISSYGIVGRIANVNSHFSTVMSVLSKGERKVSVHLPSGKNEFIHWDGNSPDYVLIDKLSPTTKVAVKDSIYTTGLGTYPENTLVGHVARIDTLEASGTINLRIKLATDFKKLGYVYVVNNDLKDLKIAVEAKNIKE